MAALIEDAQPLLTMMLVIGVLLLIVKRGAPTRKGHYYRARRDVRVLNQYDMGHHLLGPLTASLLLLSAVLDGAPELVTLSIVFGMCLAVVNRWQLFWQPVLLVIAVTAVLVESLRIVMFALAPHEEGLLAILYKIGFTGLVITFFLLGVLLSCKRIRWLSTKMLSSVVILEILMLFAEPAFEVSLAHPLVETVTWGLIAGVVAFGLGLFSFPITLDLLSVGLALALWSVDPEPPIAPVAGVAAGLLTRAVV